MPELPEVETIRRDLRTVLLGKKITNVKVNKPRMLKSELVEFFANLNNNEFIEIHRKGKLLIFHLKHGSAKMLVHLRMTGQLIYQIPGLEPITVGKRGSDELPCKHTHFVWMFDDLSQLFFNDIRTFGVVELVDESELSDKLSDFGIEPLTEEFTYVKFNRLIENRTGILKSFLLNQRNIAGIGNIYADEICFKAAILPDRAIKTLNKNDRKRLFNSCNSIIQKAIEKRGTTFSDYVDANGNKGGYYRYLKVYDREGQECVRCGKCLIKKTKVAGRGTYFCTNCQQ